jgi:hypothetical protein
MKQFFKEMILMFFLCAMILIIASFKPFGSQANEIYIGQVGANVTVTIVQDGQNNRISTKSTAQSPATLYGKNQTITFTQTGDNNRIGLYKHYYGSDNQTSSTMTAIQTGDNNIMYLDNHGDNNNFDAYQLHNNAVMDLEIDYDGNSVIAKQACNYGTDFSLQQGSNQSTSAQSYSLNQNCQTSGGCSVSVTQY